MLVTGFLRRADIEPRMLGMLIALALIWAGLDLASGGLFLSARNLYNLTVQSSVVGVLACGMVLVIVGRQIDLSVGSVLGVCGMLIATLQADVFPPTAAWGWPLALAVGVASGAAIGAWQGWWVAHRRLPAFVVTLAGLMIFRGAAYLLTDGRTVAPLHASFQRLGGGIDGSIGAAASWALAALTIAVVAALQLRARRERRQHGIVQRPPFAEALRLALLVAGVLAFVWLMNAHTLPKSEVARGIPIPVLILAAVYALVRLLARATVFGRHVYAIGGNPAAAELAGVDVRRVTLALFVLMGVLAGIAAVITTARLGAGTSSMGTLVELAVIAAAVIGGTSLAGGVGSVSGALVGAIIMQSLENGMVLLGVSSAARQLGIGLVLIGAVWLDAAFRARRGES